VFHCHIFFHAVFGMISEFVVTTPDGFERPYVNANDTLIEATGGQNVSMQGTYVDTDGEAVTLSASIGTVTDNGGGAWTWTYTTVGGENDFVYITATDAGGRKDQALFELNVNGPPVVTAADAAGDEGAAIAIHGTAVDPDGDPVTTMWSYVPGVGVDVGATCAVFDPTALDTTIICTDDGTYTLTLTGDDGVNAPVSVNATLTVANVAPTVVSTSPVSGSFYLVGTTVPVTGLLTDPGSNDVLTCAFDFDGGGPAVVAPAPGGVCSVLNTFGAAGVYTVTVTGADDDGGVSAPSSLLIVIYDPDAGFVTGGGTIDSPPGAYPADPTLAGRANLSVNAKYKKGADAPMGQTQFNFHGSDFVFHAGDYQWLVVTGAKAQYRGTGTLNGVGSYGFLLTVTDGKAPGGGGIDRFRLKVWNQSAGDEVVYDNAPGASEDIDIANPQPTRSGSIKIHK
jgi:hypothetical protein